MSTPSERIGPAAARFLIRNSIQVAAMAAAVVLIVAQVIWLAAPASQVMSDRRARRQIDDGHLGNLTALGVTPGHAIAGSDTGGVAALDKQTELFSEFDATSTAGRLPSDTIVQIEPWLARGKVLYRTRRGALTASNLGLKDWWALYPLQRCPMSPDDVEVVAPVAGRWLAAGSLRRGLCLYDSLTKGWTHFDATTGLSSSIVTDLQPIDGGTSPQLHVATASGVDTLALAAGDPPSWAISHSAAGRAVSAFEPSLSVQPAAGSGNDLAFRTASGGIGYRRPGGEWEPLIADQGYRASNMPELTVARLDDAARLLLVGTRGQGWNVYDIPAHAWLNPSTGQGTVSDIVRFNNRWWIAGSTGLDAFDPGNRTTASSLTGDAITRIVADDRTLFALSADGTIWSFSGAPNPEIVIPGSGAVVEANQVVGCVVYEGELWLAMPDARVVAYNERTHLLHRRDGGLFDEKEPVRLLQFVQSGRHLWAVTERPKGARRLSQLSGGTWIPVPTGQTSVESASATSTGVVFRGDENRLFFVPDGGTRPVEIFSAGGPEPRSASDAALAATGESFYMAPTDGPDAASVFVYDVRHHTWAQMRLPPGYRIASLYAQAGTIYGITRNGGLIRHTGQPSDSWQVIVSDSGLRDEDARTPVIVAATRTGSTIWVAFQSGNVYSYLPSSHHWDLDGRISGPVAMADGGFQEIVTTGNGDVAWLRRAANRMSTPTIFLLADSGAVTPLDTSSELVDQLVPLSPKLLLARARSGALLWYTTSTFTPVRMLHGRLRRSDVPAFEFVDDERDRQWVLFSDGGYGAYDLKRHDWLLTGSLPAESNLHIVRSGTLSSEGGFWIATPNGSHFFRQSGADLPRVHSLADWTVSRVVAVAGRLYAVATSPRGTGNLFDVTSQPASPITTDWIERRGTQLRAYGDGVRVWTSGAVFDYSPMQGLNEVSGFNRLSVLTYVVCLGMIASAIWLSALLLRWRHRKRPGRTVWRAFGVCALTVVGLIGSIMKDSGRSLWPSPQLEREWARTHEGSSLPLVEASGRPLLDQDGRFPFDAVHGLALDGSNVLLQTRAGVWSFAIPGQVPKAFDELEPTFRQGALIPAATVDYPRRLFLDGPWEWQEDRASHVRVHLQTDSSRQRAFQGIKWADELVRAIVVPQGGGRAFVDTAAGVFDCSRERCDGLGSQPSLPPAEAGRVSFAATRAPLLPGRLVPARTSGRGSRFAQDDVEDFATAGAHASSLWTRSADGVQQYSFDAAGRLSLDRSDPSDRMLPAILSPAVQYGDMRWSRRGTFFFGLYDDGTSTAPVEITGRRMAHDIVSDIALVGGRLRLQTRVGVWELTANREPRVRSLSATLPSVDTRQDFAYTGVGWSGTKGPASILSTQFKGSATRPVAWTRLPNGEYKFAFDIVRGIRLATGPVVLTDAGTFRVGTDRSLTPVPPWPSESRQRSAAVFDLEHQNWSWARQVVRQARATIRLNHTGVAYTLTDGAFPWDVVTNVTADGPDLDISTRAGRFVLRNGPPMPTGSAPPLFIPLMPTPVTSVPDLACKSEWGTRVDVKQDRSTTWLLCSHRLVRLNNEGGASP
jgi:hypothetical protein